MTSINKWNDYSWSPANLVKGKVVVDWVNDTGSKIGIYAIRTGAGHYIGYTACKGDLRARISKHFSQGRCTVGPEGLYKQLQKALKSEDLSKVHVTLLEEWSVHSKQDLGDMERKWVAKLKPSFNSNPGGNGSWSRKRVEAYLKEAEKKGFEEDLAPQSPKQLSSHNRSVRTPKKWYGVDLKTFDVKGSPGFRQRGKDATYAIRLKAEKEGELEQRLVGTSNDAAKRFSKYSYHARKSCGSGNTPGYARRFKRMCEQGNVEVGIVHHGIATLERHSDEKSVIKAYRESATLKVVNADEGGGGGLSRPRLRRKAKKPVTARKLLSSFNESTKQTKKTFSSLLKPHLLTCLLAKAQKAKKTIS